MNLIKNFINKYFLVKEIKSKTGELHFRRYRLIECSMFALYIHFINKHDEDLHYHSHPWNFWSLILKGGYEENFTSKNERENSTHIRKFLSLGFRFYDDYHKVVKLFSPTWTLVLTSPRNVNYTWGYLVNGKHVNFDEYRKNKNERQ